MQFVISGAFQPPQHLIPLAKAADEAGYAAIAFSDHAVYPETLDTPYPYTEDGTRRYDEHTEAHLARWGSGEDRDFASVLGGVVLNARPLSEAS